MKTLYKLLTALLLFGAAIQANAQTSASYLILYSAETDPDGSVLTPDGTPTTAPTSPTATSTSPIASSLSVTGSNFTTGGVTNLGPLSPGNVMGNPNSMAYSFHAQGFPSADVLDPGKYYEFTLTPQASCSFTASGFSFNDRVKPGGPFDPGFVNVRSSADGFMSNFFATDIEVTTTFMSRTRNSTTLPTPPNNTTFTSPVTFRIYYFGTADTVNLDLVRVLGRVFCPEALPVEFTSFEGKAVGNKVQLNWATSWERNADRFEIQRSQNATEFASIGQVKAAGDATDKQLYGFTDEQALPGINYYRLRQVDRDGSVQFSKIIAVTTRPEAPAIAILGNPTEGGRIKLQLFNLEPSKLQLTDMQGRSLAFRMTETAGGLVTLEPASPLSSGVYLVRAANVAAVKVIVR